MKQTRRLQYRRLYDYIIFLPNAIEIRSAVPACQLMYSHYPLWCCEHGLPSLQAWFFKIVWAGVLNSFSTLYDSFPVQIWDIDTAPFSMLSSSFCIWRVVAKSWTCIKSATAKRHWCSMKWSKMLNFNMASTHFDPRGPEGLAFIPVGFRLDALIVESALSKRLGRTCEVPRLDLLTYWNRSSSTSWDHTTYCIQGSLRMQIEKLRRRRRWQWMATS